MRHISYKEKACSWNFSTSGVIAYPNSCIYRLWILSAWKKIFCPNRHPIFLPALRQSFRRCAWWQTHWNILWEWQICTGCCNGLNGFSASAVRQFLHWKNPSFVCLFHELLYFYNPARLSAGNLQPEKKTGLYRTEQARKQITRVLLQAYRSS